MRMAISILVMVQYNTTVECRLGTGEWGVFVSVVSVLSVLRVVIVLIVVSVVSGESACKCGETLKSF